MADCCEPGCKTEALCPVHQALTDMRAKVEGLPVRLTDDGVGTSLYVFVKRADVLALIEEAGQ